MIADSTASSLNTTKTTATTTNTSGGMESSNKLTSAVGDLMKLLPTGTVFLFQFINPIVTNSGQCTTTNKYLTSILLLACAFNCFFASFTDSYTGTDNKRHYGIVTTKGLYPSPSPSPSPSSTNIDLSKYRLKFSDFVHAAFSLVVFAVLALLDINTVHCFYPDFESTQKQLLQVLPPAIGVVACGVFVIFPNTRHGIGYPTSSDPNEDTSSSESSNDSAPAPPPPPQTV